MQLKKLMIEVMVFFVLGCFLCACGKTKDQTRKTTKDENKEIMPEKPFIVWVISRSL